MMLPKRLYITNLLKTLILIDTTDLVKKADYDAKILEVEKKIPDHDKYITANKFNKLATKNFTERLKQADLASKNDIVDFVKKKDFGEKLIKINKKVPSNKTKHAEAEKKLNDHITSDTKLINDLSR